MFSKICLIVILCLREYLCEVHLTVIFQPPWATLECVITHPVEVASAILMCPGDSMCFQNCDRLCDLDNCNSNNITCSFEEIGSLKKFVYMFNASDPRNKGDWTCHYGTEKGTSVLFYGDKNQAHNKRGIQIIPTSKMSTLTPRPVKENVKKQEKLIALTTEKQHIPMRNSFKPTVLSNVNPYYVILLLVIFSISLLVNIIFLMRDILTSISTRKSFNRSNEKKYSYWLSMCIKLFCVEKLYKIRQTYKTNPLSNEINPLISRQESSNLYEYPPPIHIHPPILFENVAYAGTPGNERMPFINGCMRSKSFPLKQTEVKMYKNYPPQMSENVSTTELANQIIYDDVAEPSTHYIPIDSPLNYSSLARSNLRPRLFSINHKNQFAAVSMNNLNLRSKYLSDSVTGITDSDSGILLKDAINSRVELSKEMINHADSLLKQADDLLNKRESPRNS